MALVQSELGFEQLIQIVILLAIFVVGPIIRAVVESRKRGQRGSSRPDARPQARPEMRPDAPSAEQGEPRPRSPLDELFGLGDEDDEQERLEQARREQERLERERREREERARRAAQPPPAEPAATSSRATARRAAAAGAEPAASAPYAQTPLPLPADLTLEGEPPVYVALASLPSAEPDTSPGAAFGADGGAFERVGGPLRDVVGARAATRLRRGIDWRRAIVLSEVLAPPLGLREGGEGGLGAPPGLR